MIGDGLAYVAAAVRNVTEVARTLEQDFQMERWNCAVGDSISTTPVFPVGQTALALFELGDPFVGSAEKTGVHHLAVSVDDPAKASIQAAENGVPSYLGPLELGLGGSSRLLLDPAATGGVITYLSEPLKLPTGRTSSASGTVQRIDHVGVASSDNQLAMEVFSRRLGWSVESTQTDSEMTTTVETFTSDKYGVTHHTRQSRIAGALRVAFITIGDCEIEFLQDLNQESQKESSQRPASSQSQTEQAGSTQQDQSVISRYVDSRGPGLHHIALKVSDIDGLLANLANAGHSLIDNVGRPGSRQARIGFIHPAALGGLLVHLVQREEI